MDRTLETPPAARSHRAMKRRMPGANRRQEAASLASLRSRIRLANCGSIHTAIGATSPLLQRCQALVQDSKCIGTGEAAVLVPVPGSSRRLKQLLEFPVGGIQPVRGFAHLHAQHGGHRFDLHSRQRFECIAHLFAGQGFKHLAQVVLRWIFDGMATRRRSASNRHQCFSHRRPFGALDGHRQRRHPGPAAPLHSERSGSRAASHRQRENERPKWPVNAVWCLCSDRSAVARTPSHPTRAWTQSTRKSSRPSTD